MQYNFKEIEKKWKEKWKNEQIYSIKNDFTKPKYYVLDMFPYPSGAGLHVGHPLGYIASDIYSRYKKLKGFNVLHPMGFDAFGLPAEQYAIEHHVHPAVSTANNIKNFKQQLYNIGFCYDWDREVNTSNPDFYKWTQYIFTLLFESFYNRIEKKAMPITNLIEIFKTAGNIDHSCPTDDSIHFSAEQWHNFNPQEQAQILMNYRLMYQSAGFCNWCEELGCVLANDEIENGFSKRGGYPITKKKLKQWNLRITEYADRLLDGLKSVDFTDAMKEMQTNWIGKSLGANIDFYIDNNLNNQKITVFTTRPDTIFGVDFMVLAPEHDLVLTITTPDQLIQVEQYIQTCKQKSDTDRMKEKKVSGCFTGGYCLNPFNNTKIPIYISEYVLAGYGTGAIMAVPCGDERDFNFAKHFNIPITNIIGIHFNGNQANPTKDATLVNSDFLNGVKMDDAINIVIEKLELLRIGKRKINYKIRDAAFSRQRYWGEPIPIVYTDEIAASLPLESLPLELPHIEKYDLDKQGRGVLAQVKSWTDKNYETLTMPGAAGSSWYFLRYMDNKNTQQIVDKKISDYWNQVDLYVGGTEHATGHLMYSRMWTKFLFDLGYINFDEPYKKLLNQGMILGESWFTYVDETNKLIYPNHFIKQAGLLSLKPYRIPYAEQFFENWGKLNLDKKDALLAKLGLEGFKFVGIDVGMEKLDQNIGFDFECQIDKMSKSKYNVVNPDEIVEKYGADTFRLYEMFLGPIEQSKPWNTHSIEGVHRFIKKLWRLFYDDHKGQVWNTEPANNTELKIIHKTIKKIEEDIEKFSFNTAVSTLMICVNDLADLKCHKKEILAQLLIIITPFAPHICAELWEQIGNTGHIVEAQYPIFNTQYLVEENKNYPISINGKHRTNIDIALNLPENEIKEIVLQNEIIKKWIEGKTIQKFIFIKGKMVNIVC